MISDKDLKYKILEALFESCMTEVFIETGTHRARGLLTAIKAGFKECYSIELQAERYYDNLKELVDDKRVTLMLGDSQYVLPILLEKIKCKSTFWLDAHCSKDYNGIIVKDYPILEEIEAIGNNRDDHIILIDDLDHFGSDKKIRLIDIKEKIFEINENYKFELIDTNIKNNVLLAYV
tara:strand:- start:111 stop:644 length:534 start_codon:yes stop_codon:yes gene_type:complete